MAKQRGLIQISGKLNDMCYFQRKGSTSGLIRRINTGMSDRVKSGAEYKNLRTANSFFGACLNYASLTLNMMSDRAKYMLKPNRLSLLAGSLFRLREGYFGDYIEGVAGFQPFSSFAYSFIFDKIVKNKLFEHFGSIGRLYQDFTADDTINISISEFDLEDFVNRYKAVGCIVQIVGPFYIYRAEKSGLTGKYSFDEFGKVTSRIHYEWRPDEGDLEISIQPTHREDATNFAIITVSPVERFVGGRPIINYVGSACGLVCLYYNG